MSRTLTSIDVDFSLRLINRTGAYYLSKDLVDYHRAKFSRVHCWRLPNDFMPYGVLRKILGRFMLAEYRVLKGLPYALRRRTSDRTLFLDPLYVLRAELTAEDVVLCHDVGPLTHPEFFDATTIALYKAAYAKIREKQPGMVFVSDTSRREFIRLFGQEFRFRKVVPLYPRRETRAPGPAVVGALDKPFILGVGGLEHRKNYVRCMHAFTRSGLAEDYQYVICGPRGNATEVIHSEAARHKGVVVLGRVTDAELAWLYANAAGFVLPSLLEGFGVPIIEAAEQGLVCVASADSVQHEVLGGHAIFIDPTDIDAIARGLTELVHMPANDRQRLVSQAQAHVKTLSRERFLRAWGEILDDDTSQALSEPSAGRREAHTRWQVSR